MKILFSIVIALVCISSGIAFVLLWGGDSVSENETVYQLPTATVDNNFKDQTMTITFENGESKILPDFTLDRITYIDPGSANRFILNGVSGYCSADRSCGPGVEEVSYQIAFSQKDSYFSIVLFEEPLSQARKEAEQYFKNRIQLTEAELCQLNYGVFAPFYVSEYYAGKNLGFSFCEESVPLE